METSTGEGRQNFSQDKLLHLFRDLEQQWESMKQRNPRSPGRTRATETVISSSSSSSSSSTKPFLVTTQLQLLLLRNDDKTSPRNLMSSLQTKEYSSSSSTSEEFSWNVKRRNDDMDVSEIVRERMEAIRSGRLRGRRLFVDEESESDNAEKNNNVMKKNEEMVMGEEKKGMCESVGKWVCNVVGLSGIGLIIVFGYGVFLLIGKLLGLNVRDDDEVTLVPT